MSNHMTATPPNSHPLHSGNKINMVSNKYGLKQLRDHGEVSGPSPPGELSTACPPVSEAQPGLAMITWNIC